MKTKTTPTKQEREAAFIAVCDGAEVKALVQELATADDRRRLTLDIERIVSKGMRERGMPAAYSRSMGHQFSTRCAAEAEARTLYRAPPLGNA